MSPHAYTDAQLIARVWDQENIRDLMGRWAYFEAANRRKEALERFWVQKPENRATASFGRNWGFLQGLDEIQAYYLDRDRFGAPGTALMHPLSTKLLCLAGDGETAQGLWMGVGYECAPNSTGEPDAKWINERIAVDFLREDGQFRIWHMFIGTNYVFSTGEDYSAQPLRIQVRTKANGLPHWYNLGCGREVTAGRIALFDQIPDYPEREAFLNGKTPEEIYTALYNDPIAFPPLPEDYEHYDPRRGYGPEGFRKSFEGKA